MSFILSNKSQSQAQIADEIARMPKFLNQELAKSRSEDLSKEINTNINIGMEPSSGTTGEKQKFDFQIYSLILAGAVILGVVGYIYYSMDSKPKSLPAPETD